MAVTLLNVVVLFRFVPFRSDTHALTLTLTLTHSQTSLLNPGAAVGAAEEYGDLQQTTCRSLLQDRPIAPVTRTHHAHRRSPISNPRDTSLRLARLQRMDILALS